MERKKIATVWLGGCSGCHMSLLDIDERILDLVKMADIVKMKWMAVCESQNSVLQKVG